MCGIIFGLMSLGLLFVLLILFVPKNDIDILEMWINESISKYRK